MPFIMNGDIITFYDEEIEADVTHRIVEVSENEYYTKGDYNNARDLKPVKQENIIGKIVFNSYELGYIFINYRYYLIFLTIFTIVVLNMIFTKPQNIEINEEET